MPHPVLYYVGSGRTSGIWVVKIGEAPHDYHHYLFDEDYLRHPDNIDRLTEAPIKIPRLIAAWLHQGYRCRR
jgi:hypothetical protein